MANVDKYVNTDTGNNGNDGSSGNPWANMDQAINDAATNKSSSDTWIVHCSGNAVDSVFVNIDGVVNTTSANPIIFRSDAGTNGRHEGKWDSSKFTHYQNGNYAHNVEMSASAFVDFDGIQFEAAGAWSGQPKIFVGQIGTGRLRFLQCLMTFSGSRTSPDSPFCFSPYGSTGWTFVAVNCVAYGSRGFFLNDQGYTSHADIKIILYNNTIYDVDLANGIYGAIYLNQDSGNAYIKNNIIELAGGSLGSCYVRNGGITENNSNNLSSDGSIGSTGTKSYVNAGAGDFHLTSVDDGGTDLSGDGQYAFTVDIDNVTRSGTWDRGADEYVAAITGYKNQLLLGVG